MCPGAWSLVFSLPAPPRGSCPVVYPRWSGATSLCSFRCSRILHQIPRALSSYGLMIVCTPSPRTTKDPPPSCRHLTLVFHRVAPGCWIGRLDFRCSRQSVLCSSNTPIALVAAKSCMMVRLLVTDQVLRSDATILDCV